MEKPLSGMNVVILAASGCMEDQVLSSQRALMKTGAKITIMSVGAGLINSLGDSGWGHNFAIDKPINTALAADYDMLIIIDGKGSHDKLKTTAHSKRLISGFMMEHKPVAAFGGAVDMLIHSGVVMDYYVADMEKTNDMSKEAGALISEDNMVIWGNLLTGSTGKNSEFISAMEDHFVSFNSNEMAEAA